MGETATTSSRRARSASRTPGTASTRSDGDHGVRRADDDQLRVGQGRYDPRCRARLRRPVETHPAHRDVVVPAGRSSPGSRPRCRPAPGVLASASVSRVRSGSSVTGSSRTRNAAASAQRRRHRAERLARGEAAGAEEVSRQVAVAQPEPVLAAQPGQLVHDGPALAGHAPSGLAVVHPGQRVGHGVEVRADARGRAGPCRRRR